MNPKLEPLFHALKATGKFPSLALDHLMLVNREYPGADLISPTTSEDLVLTATGVAGLISNVMPWLRKQASRIELKRTGGFRDASPNQTQYPESRSKPLILR